ncbi:MAG: HEPN domain-containing protein [Acidobacteria bacterium]|nr:HEPN domain-containing protein [Acidobacteriota bacterium]
MPESVRRAGAPEARAYLHKAEAYLEAARADLEAGRPDPATSCAIHAGISAADAISAARTGRRSAGADHRQTIALLRSAGREGAEAARHLERLLPLKNLAEYDYASVSRARAESALRSADRIVSVARRALASLGRA